MPIHLQIRNLPDGLHQTLSHRAAQRGLSLRQYTLEVLSQHCSLPTMDEWLEELHRLPPVAVTMPAAEALHQAREENEQELMRALARD